MKLWPIKRNRAEKGNFVTVAGTHREGLINGFLGTQEKQPQLRTPEETENNPAQNCLRRSVTTVAVNAKTQCEEEPGRGLVGGVLTQHTGDPGLRLQPRITRDWWHMLARGSEVQDHFQLQSRFEASLGYMRSYLLEKKTCTKQLACNLPNC